MRWLVRLALLAAAAANKRLTVTDMDSGGLREAVSRFPQVVVLMHNGSAEVQAFQPWLYALAQAVPKLRFTRIHVGGEARAVRNAFRVATLPSVKIFQRDHEAGKRISDYTGPPLDFDEMLEWCEAVAAGREHRHSQPAYEPPIKQDGEGGPTAAAPRAGSSGGSKKKGGVPDSVRLMSETMVKETRLMRILEQQGPEATRRYQGRLSYLFQKILDDEGITQEESFKVQDANRRARDQTREEFMTGAPEDLIQEVERPVLLGAKAKDEL